MRPWSRVTTGSREGDANSLGLSDRVALIRGMDIELAAEERLQTDKRGTLAMKYIYITNKALHGQCVVTVAERVSVKF